MSFTVEFNSNDSIDLEPFAYSDLSTMMMSQIANSLSRPKQRHISYRVEADIGECNICQSTMKKGDLITRLPCGENVSHAFHKHCIQPWLEINNTCPNCRSEV